MSNKKLSTRESHTRSFLKGISWRIIATLATISIAFLITGKLKFALEIGVVEVFAKLALYYFHERLWQINFAAKLSKYKLIIKSKFSAKKTLPTRYTH